MARQIVIDFAAHPSDIHRIRNFSEELHQACAADGWASIPWSVVDRPARNGA